MTHCASGLRLPVGWSFFVALCVCGLLAACGSDVETGVLPAMPTQTQATSIPEKDRATSAPNGGAEGDLPLEAAGIVATAELFPELTAELEDRLGGPVRATYIGIYDGYVIWRVQDPSQPTHLDQYQWRAGEMTGPTPEKAQPDRLEADLFALDGVNLAAGPALIRHALSLGVEDGEVIAVQLIKLSTGVIWQVGLSGPRENKTVHATPDGAVYDVH